MFKMLTINVAIPNMMVAWSHAVSKLVITDQIVHDSYIYNPSAGHLAGKPVIHRWHFPR